MKAKVTYLFWHPIHIWPNDWNMGTLKDIDNYVFIHSHVLCICWRIWKLFYVHLCKQSFPGAPWDPVVRTQAHTFRKAWLPAQGSADPPSTDFSFQGPVRFAQRVRHICKPTEDGHSFFSPKGSLQMWS